MAAKAWPWLQRGRPVRKGWTGSEEERAKAQTAGRASCALAVGHVLAPLWTRGQTSELQTRDPGAHL